MFLVRSSVRQALFSPRDSCPALPVKTLRSTTVRRTDCRSSQAELCLHSCTESSASLQYKLVTFLLVHNDFGCTLSAAPESTNDINSFPPRVLSFRSVTVLMVAVESSHQFRPNRSCQHRWTALFRLHPLMGRAWQDGLFHHTCCR